MNHWRAGSRDMLAHQSNFWPLVCSWRAQALKSLVLEWKDAVSVLRRRNGNSGRLTILHMTKVTLAASSCCHVKGRPLSPPTHPAPAYAQSKLSRLVFMTLGRLSHPSHLPGIGGVERARTLLVQVHAPKYLIRIVWLSEAETRGASAPPWTRGRSEATVTEPAHSPCFVEISISSIGH
jgi:hypothetical protein